MRKAVHFAVPDLSLQSAALLMADTDVGFLPVCDDGLHVWGVLTDRDIVVRACAMGCAPATTPVKDVMTRAVIACRPDDSIDHAEELMEQHRKSRILVTDEQAKLLGVISLSDIALLERPGRAGRTLRRIASREARAAR
jgi:CBS domain-containing protein